MVDFEAGAGFSVNGNQVTVDFSEQPDEVVLAARAELDAVAGNRDLLAEEAAGVAVANSVEPITPELLVATVGESGAWYTKVAKDLNKGRRSKKDKVDVVPEDELPGRAENWINKERQEAIEAGLDYDEESPVLLLAVPNTRVFHKEIVQTWANARGGKLWGWGGRMAFLRDNWSADELSGYDEAETEEPVRFVAIETGYDEERAGNLKRQLTALQGVQADYPSVRLASLFEGGILANRYSEQSNPNWRDTYVRQIELQSDNVGYVPYAEVDVGGYADVDGSHAGDHGVSRRLVG